MGDVPLDVNFALSRPKLVTVVVTGAVFSRNVTNARSICIAIIAIAIEYLITDNVH